MLLDGSKSLDRIDEVAEDGTPVKIKSFVVDVSDIPTTKADDDERDEEGMFALHTLSSHFLFPSNSKTISFAF